MPTEVYDQIQKALKEKPGKQHGLVFQSRGQRSTQFIDKGLVKPGKISYDTLRRAALSVHIVRICIHTLKQKVTKTKWAIQNTDLTKRKMKDPRIKEVTDLFKHPNTNDESFRTLLDKMVEDLLTLDAVSIEKTRYPTGALAELYFVDSATIRPVYDEYGNQDILIPLQTEASDKLGEPDEELPTSYVQVLDNSQYGGPESGQIVAAWPKRDFIHFHMNPQGAMESFGYGLSPIEGILSVVSNILNADNYNSTYFEEGAFPPIVLQLIGQVNQRDLEAYREYLVAELSGNFHRPAIMATEKAESLQIHNLKNFNNRDMEFMEYQNWLAKLCCAMFGLSPGDIGLTDTQGSKNVAEEQTEIAEAKGYSSILALFKEVFNQDIIWKDFGYEDLEFDWVATDQQSPGEASTMYDRDLKNGSVTLNEVRAKRGLAPYPEWADEPMILLGDGYKVIDPEKAAEQQQAQQEHELKLKGANSVGGEKPYNDQDEDGDRDGTKIEKSGAKTLYINRPIMNAEDIIAWAKAQGFVATLPAEDMHVTVAFSKKPVDWNMVGLDKETFVSAGGPRSVEALGDAGAIVLKFADESLRARWGAIRDMGASWDYDSYKPHITISYSGGVDLANVIPYDGPIYLGAEKRAPVNDDWRAGITEKMRKAVLTFGGYRTWADDRGYSQPFIWMDVKGGWGQVIKPPVAVNLDAAFDLEVELTGELARAGLNVRPVRKMTFIEVQDMLRSNPEVYNEFLNYCNMTPEYDSEKWRSKFGSGRKFNYYLVSDYIDGYALSNPLLKNDMKRDPDVYIQAVRDLAALWLMERDMVLGDRRADQYIIGHDKRAYGIDYQFKGDQDRYERTKDSISEALADVPELKAVFDESIASTQKARRGFWERVIKSRRR